jgi:two-component system chemotaxis response regulator CheB
VIRVLIAEDSAVVREFLQHMLGSDPGIEVVGTARDGEEAVEMTCVLKPHVVTMDINMPRMDGLKATRRIMESCPVPIVVVSASWNVGEAEKGFLAMQAGAVAVCAKPRGGVDSEAEREIGDLIRTVKLMSEVRVVRRSPKKRGSGSGPAAPRIDHPSGRIRAVAIGASAGGPVPVHDILSALPKGFPAPVFVVQHIAPGFVSGFVEWLSGSSRLKVRVAADNERVEPGRVYVAPDGFHMGLNQGERIALGAGEPENGMRPSISHLFRSVVDTYGAKAAGILLSGMGTDGAAELKRMRDAGAVTFAQEEESCAVYGMPGEAARLGAALYTLAPEEIAAAIGSLACAENGAGERR